VSSLEKKAAIKITFCPMFLRLQLEMGVYIYVFRGCILHIIHILEWHLKRQQLQHQFCEARRSDNFSNLAAWKKCVKRIEEEKPKMKENLNGSWKTGMVRRGAEKYAKYFDGTPHPTAFSTHSLTLELRLKEVRFQLKFNNWENLGIGLNLNHRDPILVKGMDAIAEWMFSQKAPDFCQLKRLLFISG